MKKPNYTKEDLYHLIETKDAVHVASMIRNGALEALDNEELKDLLPKLMELRNRDVIDQLAKRTHYFPIELLRVNTAVRSNREFLSYVLTKHGKKFRYKDPENARLLFAAAVESECRPMILFLLGKGLAEGEYPRLASGPEISFECIKEIKPSALHPDTVVTFFVEAAISGRAEQRISALIDFGFNRFTENSEGLDCCEVLSRGISQYPYPEGKKGEAEKQRDLEGLQVLRNLCGHED